MGVPTSEVGYTSAMPRREDHEVRKGHVGHWIKKKFKKSSERTPICGNGGQQTKFDEDTIRHPERGVRKCFQQWQKRWAKCVAAEGNYVEDN